MARRQKLKRACNITTQAIEQGEVVAARNAKHMRSGIPLAFFRKEATKERAALTPVERFKALGQRRRERVRILVGEPSGRIGEAELAVLILGQLTDESLIPSNRERANAHDSPLAIILLGVAVG